jgi:Tfp pilus assembly protein PilF
MREWTPVLTLLAVVSLAGCSGGQAPRPKGPDEKLPVEALMARADSSAAKGAKAEARTDYARAAEAAKHAGRRDLEFRAELTGGRLSLDLSEPETARRSLARAVQLNTQSAEAHDALGLLHLATRRYMDAKTEFDRAAALDTMTAIPLYHLGQAYAQAGDSTRAAEAYQRALLRDPNHEPTLAALGTALDSRYRAAGLPEGYPLLRGHPSVSRGELGVMLAEELGADPERPSWRSGTNRPSDTEEARGAWGERWLRAAIERGWITPFPDGSFHLGDPVTRGTLALLVAEIAGGAKRSAASATDPFPDLGRRHYLARAASEAVAMGLPTRGLRFEPSASVTGAEALAVLKGLGQRLGVAPVVGEEQRPGGVVK